MARVAVVMPVWRQKPAYLNSAIRSVLSQRYRNYRFCIVIDGADATVRRNVFGWKARYPRIVVIDRATRRGIARSLNEGFGVLRNCSYRTWVSSDNVYSPGWLGRLVRALDAAPKRIGLVYSSFRTINRSGHVVVRRRAGMDRPKRYLLKRDFIGMSFLYRASSARRVGGYRPGFEQAEDYDYWLRLTEVCDIQYVPAVLVSYRVGGRYAYTTTTPQRYIIGLSRRAAAAARVRRRLKRPQ